MDDNQPQPDNSYVTNKSELIDAVKIVVVELIESTALVSEVLSFGQDNADESKSKSIPMQIWVNTARRVILWTRDVIDPALKEELEKWLDSYKYDPSRKRNDARNAVEFTQRINEELFKLGIIDLNVRRPKQYPYAIMADLSG